MNNVRKFIIAGLIAAVVLFLTFVPVEKGVQAFHTPEELTFYHGMVNQLSIDSNQYFPTQTLCGGCHGYDQDGFALVDMKGTDVNIYDDWRTTMMANSAKDPFWRAKVSHESLVNPEHSEALETKCTSCHAPMGQYTSRFHGHDIYTMDSLLVDTIGLDGVSCGACHQISTLNLGNQHSGEINYDTSRVQYGPYPSPFAAPMTSFVGFTPIESSHINDAGICASCHTLITKSVDLDGNFTGSTFVEQATYHEWLNSIYNTDSVTCQACHMPRIQDSVVISDNYLFLQGRSPFGLHDLVGGNTFMLKLMRDNKEALDINAEDFMYNETIEKTLVMLQQKSLDISLDFEQQVSDTAYFKIQLSNKAGHKFPSGYPSRRAFIEFVITTEEGDTLFKSGVLDNTYEVEGHDANFEPHYQIINQTGQVQIYELVDGDVNGNFTTVLERAFVALKDNRLAPIGFTTSHEVYDTTQIVGNALNDPDFNKDNIGAEGSGTDIVYYHIPLDNYEGLINISAKVFYQSLPPRWVAEMFEESTPEIETFRSMFDEADQSPVLVASANLNDLFVESTSTFDLESQKATLFYPNPTFNGNISFIIHFNQQIEIINIYNQYGDLVKSIFGATSTIQLPKEKGIYFVEIITEKGRIIEKVIRL